MKSSICHVDEKLAARVNDALVKKLKKKNTPEFKYYGANVHTLGDEQNGCYVLEEEGEISYFVTYKAIKIAGWVTAWQVSTWRETMSTTGTGFGGAVFFDKLLPKYHTLVSDQLQTDRHMRFWQYAILNAMERKLPCYIVNNRKSPAEIVPLTSLEEFSRNSHLLWRKDEVDVLDELVFLMVTTKPISDSADYHTGPPHPFSKAWR